MGLYTEAAVQALLKAKDDQIDMLRESLAAERARGEALLQRLVGGMGVPSSVPTPPLNELIQGAMRVMETVGGDAPDSGKPPAPSPAETGVVPV